MQSITPLIISALLTVSIVTAVIKDLRKRKISKKQILLMATKCDRIMQSFNGDVDNMNHFKMTLQGSH